MGVGIGHCETCRWWGAERRHDDNMPVGTCRAAPPQSGKPQVLTYHDPDRPEVAGPLVERGQWRWVAFDDWCGYHAQEATPPKRPVAFRVRDCADGWIIYQDEKQAYDDSQARGAQMQGLYVRDGT